ncbi:MAG TPA: DUF5131 family protein [Phycisphaerales bacterium]|nr:DUF5131 family protein [Phycisphaerales bacterium]
MPTKIEWTEVTWNPIVGCSKVSSGCDNCYAERMAYRLAHMGLEGYAYVTHEKGGWNGKIYRKFSGDVINKPLHWRKPRMIFVSSMGDLFHENVPFEWVLKIIGIAIVTPWHTYQILTKRPERMLEFFDYWPKGWFLREAMKFTSFSGEFFALDSIKHLVTDKQVSKANDYWIHNYDQSRRGKLDGPVPFPTPNLWLGVTAENQEQADFRIPKLLEIPAAVRFVSIEPMLAEIDFDQIYPGEMFCPACRGFFDEPKEWTSPCCGSLAEAVVHGCSERCDECKEVFNVDEQIPTCPHCDNSGDGHYIQPDYVNCFSVDREGAVLEKLDWVIVGPETGPGARPMKLEWAEKIVSDCKDADVPCFVKKLPIDGKVTGVMQKWPEHLRVRQYPRGGK